MQGPVTQPVVDEDSDVEIDRLRVQLERCLRDNAALEKTLEERTRSLYQVQEELRDSAAFLTNVMDSLLSAVIITDGADVINTIGGATCRLSGHQESDLIGRHLSYIISFDAADGEVPYEDGMSREGSLLTRAEGPMAVLVATSDLTDEDDEIIGRVYTATDVSQRKNLEVQLRHAQRLESIGQLAAGVAHEINTPIQFIGDSVRFLGDVFEDMLGIYNGYQPLRAAAATGGGQAPLLEKIDELEEEADLEFIREEAPKALTRTLDGVERVAAIVKALKQFSHPGTDDMAPANVNEIIETTLTVSKNEYRYSADLQLNLGEVPEVVCNRGDLGQVFINLVVNAAHAIAAQVESTDTRGIISVTSMPKDDGVLITIGDTGGGIPPEIQDRVFEPFFTTKEPGKGTGQGLSLAHNMIVGKHNGSLTFTVEPGIGTTFDIWIPQTQQ
jgi:signal transduction histidine kinase